MWPLWKLLFKITRYSSLPDLTLPVLSAPGLNSIQHIHSRLSPWLWRYYTGHTYVPWGLAGSIPPWPNPCERHGWSYLPTKSPEILLPFLSQLRIPVGLTPSVRIDSCDWFSHIYGSTKAVNVEQPSIWIKLWVFSGRICPFGWSKPHALFYRYPKW